MTTNLTTHFDCTRCTRTFSRTLIMHWPSTLFEIRAEAVCPHCFNLLFADVYATLQELILK